MGTVFAERAIIDPDPDVRLAAIRTIEKLNRGHGRARDLILSGARSDDVRVRRSCIAMLPKLMSDDELRVLVDDLLKTESDDKLVETLKGYRFDAMLEGTEEQKNAALSPALPVPEIDREVLIAQGKRVGMQPMQNETAPSKSDEPTLPEPSEERANPPPTFERRPTQDELMGYHDDDDEFDGFFDESHD